MDIDEILDNFAYLDDWEDKYRYLIDLGRSLEPLPEALHTDAYKVRGCASQVWLETSVEPQQGAGEPVLCFRGDSDAHLVRGLIALLIALFSGRTAEDILATDALALFQRLGLEAHLTPQRSNGLRAMLERVRNDARLALAA
ncbi:MAG: SufE family protein [Methylobacteriaceae bacterium]|nr:SufE family protein [Methylobacteriaceae bacterium]